MTNPDMIISSSPLPAERILVFSGMAGTSSVIPSRLVGNYQPEVKAYLKAFTSEQLQAAVTPKQVTPLFPVKIVPLSRLIQGKMFPPGITASQLFVYARDAAFFKTLFFSGDRANDLTLVKTQEILRFPQNVWGKSLRDGSANLFSIRRHSDSSVPC